MPQPFADHNRLQPAPASFEISRRVVVLSSLLIALVIGRSQAEEIRFPDSRPAGGSYARPRADEHLAVSPPGFCWWRAGSPAVVRYRLVVQTPTAETVYRSPLLDDPVHVPNRVFPAGRYTWTVEAIDAQGLVRDNQPAKSFIVEEEAYQQPWIPAAQLLERVEPAHPRLLFPQASLAETRRSLATSRKEAFQSLRSRADRDLRLKPPPEPDYDQITDPAKRRLAYVRSFGDMRRYHQGAMLHLALMYLMTEEEKYGQRAKAILLGATEWDPEGVSSVMGRYGDEIGLGLAKSAALTYDWIHDLLSPSEQERVRGMLIARADQMLRRLQKRDFLCRPGSSHDGRLPGYLIEHSISLAEEPRAAVWMDYALRAVLGVFPHWAGRDGGWAEGLSYGSAYNTIFITPFESLRHATGLDIWQRPFYAKLPYFFLYNTSPRGEIMGFGDSYQGSVSRRSTGLRGLIQFHAERTEETTLQWWVNLLREDDGSRPGLPALPGLILPQRVEPVAPQSLPSDAAFRGVGWAALHSDLLHPENDLFVAFKSSPYGPVSHSYADQNSFAILMGGRVLARPGGVRYPHHGTPFHTRYTQQTIAQNSILVSGEGQINRDANANGFLTGFRTHAHFAYVCGNAGRAYGARLERFRRHVLLIKPSVVCVVDDLLAPAPSSFQWLMHAPERLELNASSQSFVSRRREASMNVRLFTAGGFDFSQTDEWPVHPKTGFPTASSNEPDKVWHFTAATRQRARARRIAAVMAVGNPQQKPQLSIETHPPERITLRVTSPQSVSVATIRLEDDGQGEPILTCITTLPDGRQEKFEAD